MIKMQMPVVFKTSGNMKEYEIKNKIKVTNRNKKFSLFIKNQNIFPQMASFKFVFDAFEQTLEYIERCINA